MSRQQLMFVLYICYFGAFFCVSGQFYESNETNNNVHVFPAYAIASQADLLGSAKCGSELRDFRRAVDHRVLWGLKTLDSSGGPKSGFFYGNNFWLGSRSQCLDITNKKPFEIAKWKLLNNTYYRNPQDEFPPFKMDYFVAYLKHNSTLQYHMGELKTEDLITLGLCLPASCSGNNISFILKRIFHDRMFLINDLYSLDLSLIRIKDMKDDHQWLLNGTIPFICIFLVVTLLMMICGTIYDIFIYQNYLKKKNGNVIDKKILDCDLNVNINEMEVIDSSSLREKSRIGDILICFSIYTNTKKIFSSNRNSEMILSLHGLRFISMIWVIIVHVIFYEKDFLDNKIWVVRFAEGLPIQVVSNASFVVDTFFFLSGFLMAYLYMKKEYKQERKSIDYRTKLKEFFMGVMKRYIRLTPPYIMMIAIVQLNSAWYDKTSQFYFVENLHENCAKYWWRNLLYINNLFDYNEMCMTWSWYLASDMQFFIIGFALIILSTIYFYLTIVVLAALLMGSIILTGYITYIYEYVPTLDEQYRLVDVLYFPPWIRIGPYIIGIIVGYIMSRLNKNVVLKKKIVILCWSLSSICNILVLFGLYKRQISVLSSVIYTALSRTVWAVTIAWIVIICSTKNKGIVKELLTSKIWIPLSRLTYCAYLVNPFIIQSTSLYSETATHFEFLTFSTMSIGYFGITYFCAYALTLMAETPYTLLIRKFVEPCTKKYIKNNYNAIAIKPLSR